MNFIRIQDTIISTDKVLFFYLEDERIEFAMLGGEEISIPLDSEEDAKIVFENVLNALMSKNN